MIMNDKTSNDEYRAIYTPLEPDLTLSLLSAALKCLLNELLLLKNICTTVYKTFIEEIPPHL